MRCRRSTIAPSGMSTRKGRISVSLDIVSTSLHWLSTTDGRTSWLRTDVRGQRHSSRASGIVGIASRLQIGRTCRTRDIPWCLPWSESGGERPGRVARGPRLSAPGCRVPRAAGASSRPRGRALSLFAVYGRGLSWLIPAWWLIGGAGLPVIHRRAGNHRGNRRVPPPGVAPAAFCGGCDVRGGGGGVMRSPWPRWPAGGQAGPLHRWHAPVCGAGGTHATRGAHAPQLGPGRHGETGRATGA